MADVMSGIDVMVEVPSFPSVEVTTGLGNQPELSILVVAGPRGLPGENGETDVPTIIGEAVDEVLEQLEPPVNLTILLENALA